MFSRFRLVLLLISLHVGGTGAAAQQPAQANSFVGSETCGTCHSTIYERWRKTLMANVLQDVKERPEAIIGDFDNPHPLVTFKSNEIVFTYGSKWKQRYYTKIGDDYYVFPVQWDVLNKTWRQYYVSDGTDWWTKYYPAEQMKRPTGPLCDGCHSTDYNIQTKQVMERNVGCEKCHGPGGSHVKDPTPATIVNPARIDYITAADVCIQCHSQGQALNNPIEGQYYDWPVGYLPGERLATYWRLEEHHLGEETFTHWPEGSAHKNRMQGNDFVQSVMYAKGVKCSHCHDVHGTSNPADTLRPGNALCLQCHGPRSPNGPAGSLEEHTQHSAGSPGSRCIECHMPKIAKTVGDVNVRSHTFRFITPAMSEKYKIPNACTSCHAGRSNDWATEELRKWRDVSPWRLED